MALLPRVHYHGYYFHEPLTCHLHALAAGAPDRVRLHDLYTSPEGRQEWLLEVTDLGSGTEGKPGYLVHANLHAPEVSGATAALRLVERLITEAEFADLLSEVVFYVVPRVNPDGAEYALQTGGPIRSGFEPAPCRNGLVLGDINGDGLILTMRWQDPHGGYVCDEVDPRLMRARQADDAGPFYQVTAEGTILDYDGGPIHSAWRGFDFNRNWGHDWRPEHEQWGAGNYAFSQPEVRAIADWVLAHPNIFGMLGFHNGCNAVLRPSATVDDDSISAGDLRVLRGLAEDGAAFTGFPAMPVRMYKVAGASPLSLRGHFTDWGYLGLGLPTFEIELGNSFNAAGITTDAYFNADDASREGAFRRQVLSFLDADADRQGFVDWEPCPHPQLGEVEVGGLQAVSYACPPAAALETIAASCADFIAHLARRRPRLVLEPVQVNRISGPVYRIAATVANPGALATNLTERALSLAGRKPVKVRLQLAGGARLVSRSALHEVPSLAATTGSESFEWFVVADEPGATACITASHPQAGTARAEVALA